jgi:hypothetical protein
MEVHHRQSVGARVSAHGAVATGEAPGYEIISGSSTRSTTFPLTTLT